jgi:hypothetical protein
MEQPCGIITMAPPTKHADKAKLIDPIGVWAHFDDSPEVCSAILNETHAIAYLMNNPGWEANQECRSHHCRVTAWSQIENIIASYTH